jgi:arylsulfatase A
MSRPNIILILADDMGYGDFAVFNNGISSTPTLDALIEESLCFTQHYAASCVCNPSRAALLTGRYPHRTGSVDTLEWRGLDRLALRETTLGDVLKDAGYATGVIGKWHLGAFDKRYHPNARGFDEAVCFRGGMHDYFRWRIEYNHRVVRADGRYLTDVWTDEAVDFIHRHQGDPFLLHLTYNAPHTPLQAPEEEIHPFAEKGCHTRAVSILYAMIHRMDIGISRILEVLREYGLEENTIVMFTSDNGPYLGGQGENSLKRYNCGFNGAKRSVYEGGIRVPMVLRWPAELKGGRRISEMIHFCDWLPTMLAIAGVEMPPDSLPLDGIDQRPLLFGEKTDTAVTRYWQWNMYSPVPFSNAAIRDGDWKLVRPAIRETMEITDADKKWLGVSTYGPEHFITQGLADDPEPSRDDLPIPRPELYNIAEDSLERSDLSEVEPSRLSRMLRDLESWFEEVESDRLSINDKW